MAELGVITALRKQQALVPEHGGSLIIPAGFVTPGFIATATCLGNSREVSGLTYRDERHEGLFEAMQVPFLLTGVDGYLHARVNQGTHYSPVQILQDANDVDRATSETNGCIRAHVDRLPGINKLCDVIGELHDNVRAHAEGTGFSMSLCWNQYGDEDKRVIEFAVADSGQGFLRECRRRGIEAVTDDETAIRWCLTPRNSTKDRDHDEFAQQQPEDAMGNPFGAGLETRRWHNGNHHQGLGLAHLMSLVSAYNGEMWLASGERVLVSNTRTRNADEIGNFVAVPHWQGVIIACRLKISELGRNIEEEPLTEDVENLLDDLLF
ncbi:hypothetical protein HBJ58_08940 [Halomonas desiderata]|uniref:hypothetical protein n=1 Tax=Billgrantia desiderata TaxID=52021 RepID=UPI001747E54F|nr:hypothetical protein [Halomonas desiderata]MCE8011676.1 hypothetical protein [Halomonas desiderata]NIC36803.1 hypothetical protein [Halomonas desiderata]